MNDYVCKLLKIAIYIYISSYIHISTLDINYVEAMDLHSGSPTSALPSWVQAFAAGVDDKILRAGKLCEAALVLQVGAKCRWWSESQQTSFG